MVLIQTGGSCALHQETVSQFILTFGFLSAASSDFVHEPVLHSFTADCNIEEPASSPSAVFVSPVCVHLWTAIDFLGFPSFPLGSNFSRRLQFDIPVGIDFSGTRNR